MAEPFTITIDDREVQAALTRLSNGIRNPTHAMQDIGRALGNITENAFQAEASPFGGKWPDLAEATLIGRGRRAVRGQSLRTRRGNTRAPALRAMLSAQMLRDTGVMVGSLTHGGDSNSGWVGIGMKYAAIHQFGGRAGRGHSVEIPARPFMPVDISGNLAPVAQAEILRLVNAYLANLT